MNLVVDIIDSQCSLRRRHLAIRAERYLAEHGGSPASAQVRDFGSVGSWLQAASLRAADNWVVVLHASESEPQWEAVPATVESFQSDQSDRSILLVTYSGGKAPMECFSVPAAPGAPSLEPLRTSWWKHYGDVRSRRDHSRNPVLASRVGMDRDRPPIESLLGEAVPTITRQGRAGSIPARSFVVEDDNGILDEGKRHAIVNAVGPLREALDYALATGTQVDCLDDLWSHLKVRLNAIRNMPAWIMAMIHESESRMPPRSVNGKLEPEILHYLSVQLAALDGFIASLDRAQFSWSATEGALPTNSETYQVLWLDDEPVWHDSLQPAFSRFGLRTTFVATVEQLPAKEDLTHFDAIVVDLILEGQAETVQSILGANGINPVEPISDETAGLGVLQLLQGLPLPPPVFVLSARESPTVVRACTRLGAQDYFVKGRGDYVHLLVALRREAERSRQQAAKLLRPANPRLIVGGAEDPLSKTLLWVDRIASSGTRGPVMLVGEPGVGKEEFARELYLRSSRRSKPFVTIDCSTIAPTIIESELFGHKKGAFSGAVSDKRGLFELADGGVAFIDELDKLEVSLQQRLLRVAANGEFRRVGDINDKTVDVLLILASNVDPRKSDGASLFSTPLVTRFEKYMFRLPPLRLRCGVARSIAVSLCDRIATELGWEPRRLLPDALDWLDQQVAGGRFDEVGGNIRGMYNLIERALVFSPDRLELGAREVKLATSDSALNTAEREGTLRDAGRIAADSIQGSGQGVLKAVKDEFEAEVLRELIGRVGRQETARLLCTTDANLRQTIKKLRDKGLWLWDL